jgi:hypothetical protein
LSLASDLQDLERELGAVTEHQGGVIVERLLDVVKSFRDLMLVAPPNVIAAVKTTGMSCAIFVGKKIALGYPVDRALDKLLAEVKTHAPSLASTIDELQGLVGPEHKRAA